MIQIFNSCKRLVGGLPTVMATVVAGATVASMVACAPVKDGGISAGNSSQVQVEIASVEKTFIGDRYSNAFQFQVKFKVNGVEANSTIGSYDDVQHGHLAKGPYYADVSVACRDSNCNTVGVLVTAWPDSYTVSGQTTADKVKIPMGQLAQLYVDNGNGALTKTDARRGSGEITSVQSLF